MGDAHLHAQVLVQLVLEMGTRHMRGGMTRGLEPLEHRGMYFMDVSVSAILQSGFSVCPEVLEPAVRRGATSTQSNFLWWVEALEFDARIRRGKAPVHFCLILIAMGLPGLDLPFGFCKAP